MLPIELLGGEGCEAPQVLRRLHYLPRVRLEKKMAGFSFVGCLLDETVYV